MAPRERYKLSPRVVSAAADTKARNLGACRLFIRYWIFLLNWSLVVMLKPSEITGYFRPWAEPCRDDCLCPASHLFI